MQYIVCYSGGHSSALVAIEAVRAHGKDNVILLNHNISPEVEHEDIKRFKLEIADYLGLPITYANAPDWETATPLNVAIENYGFQFSPGRALCTAHLKTKPFRQWLDVHFPGSTEYPRDEVTILYGFDATETTRMIRRSGIMASMGYLTDFPLARWVRTIKATEELGIARPSTYDTYKHANCIGCLKAGRQHWYIVYCLRPDIWDKAKAAEEQIGHSIIKGVYLDDLEPKFEAMRRLGITPTDKTQPATFWADVRHELGKDDDCRPCECSF